MPLNDIAKDDIIDMLHRELAAVRAELKAAKEMHAEALLWLATDRARLSDAEASCAALQAPAQEGEWEPLPDEWSDASDETLCLRIKHGGRIIRTTNYAVYGSVIPVVDDHRLPADVRLCRRTSQPAGVALREAATAALGWIDDIYPPDIFIGKSEDADEGVKMIAKIREELRAALGQRPGDAQPA